MSKDLLTVDETENTVQPLVNNTIRYSDIENGEEILVSIFLSVHSKTAAKINIIFSYSVDCKRVYTNE